MFIENDNLKMQKFQRLLLNSGVYRAAHFGAFFEPIHEGLQMEQWRNGAT